MGEEEGKRERSREVRIKESSDGGEEGSHLTAVREIFSSIIEEHLAIIR